MTMQPTTSFGAQFQSFEPEVKPRTSALAVTSLVLGILCCIPFAGVLAMLFGGGSLVGISRSRGRVKGIGLAVTGCVLGLLSTLMYLGGIIAINATAGILVKEMNATLVALDQQDITGLRTQLTPEFEKEITDEQIKAFMGMYQEELGSSKALPSSGWAWITELLAFWMAHPGAQADVQMRSGSNQESMIPAVVEFEKGKAMVVMVGQQGAQSASPTKMFPLDDLKIVTESEKTLSLREMVKEEMEKKEKKP